ncbi:5-oxoproline transporter, DUF979 family subunit [Cryobacterium sp. Y57]|uniref:5-oxoproline transporter, DUF979 family subunit n=1 Tax=Cryobacterium sp. Y57 TaxID=2048287 RepID=UPI0011B0EF33|nr:DUF979 family protein [Cryobacterium sp. Y57]
MLILIGVFLIIVGIFLFSVLMGNGFAALPIMTAAIGWPVGVQIFNGNPAAVYAIGMLPGVTVALI